MLQFVLNCATLCGVQYKLNYMKTITQLESDLSDLGKPLCRRQVYHYLKTLNLRPVGPGKPHLYPDSTSHTLATYLGLKADCTGVLPLSEIKRRAKGKAQVFAVMVKAGVNTLTLRSKKGGGQ